jgi:hypothetical protein
MMIAALLCDACSDVCETFELWDGARRVDTSMEQTPALTAEQINARPRNRRANEIAIRDGEWLIAQSQRLLEQIERLTDKAARRC